MLHLCTKLSRTLTVQYMSKYLLLVTATATYSNGIAGRELQVLMENFAVLCTGVQFVGVAFS